MKTFRNSILIASLLAAVIPLAACDATNNNEALSGNHPYYENKVAETPAQQFDSPDAAVKALLDATQAADHPALRAMFGSEVEQLLSGDSAQDAVEFANFAKALSEMCNPVSLGEDKVVLYIGAKNWPFPIPLVRTNGKWHFDTIAGRDEILNRRIGEDELTAISVCRAYVAAQHDYAGVDHNGDGILSYAQRINSTPDRHDGLYWQPVEGEDLSPLGPLVADAQQEGYDTDKPLGRTEPYHGYYFKILKAQGSDAPGGKYNYVINGNMVAGFALVAYPAHWGESGVMTFIVNQNGKVYERNLGEKSADTGAAMTEFNPGQGWSVVAGDGASTQ